jgi:hypothetical protein
MDDLGVFEVMISLVAELLELFVLQTLSMRFLQTHHLSGV